MTPNDKPNFLRAMYVCAEALAEPLTETRVEAYFLALADLEAQRVLDAWVEAVKRCKFFPKPVELREFVGEQITREWRERVHRERVARLDAYKQPPPSSEEERAECQRIIAETTQKLTKPYEGN